MNENQPFWMVWNPQGHPPTVAHATPEQARAEAERLARQIRGQTFYVLAATDAYLSNDVQRTRLHDDVPF